CISNTRWPTVPIACRCQTVKYPNSDSPLAFYLTSKPAKETIVATERRAERVANL
ncbi:hypothetical protein BgiMline_029774, partial [Biomphalaria glabrata]